MKLAADSVLHRRVRWGLCAVLVSVAVVPSAMRFVGRAEATAKSQPGQCGPFDVYRSLAWTGCGAGKAGMSQAVRHYPHAPGVF